jgi:hypothetical protein
MFTWVPDMHSWFCTHCHKYVHEGHLTSKRHKYRLYWAMSQEASNNTGSGSAQ